MKGSQSVRMEHAVKMILAETHDQSVFLSNPRKEAHR